MPDERMLRWELLPELVNHWGQLLREIVHHGGSYPKQTTLMETGNCSQMYLTIYLPHNGGHIECQGRQTDGLP